MADSPRRSILHLDSGRELRGGQWQVIRLLRGLRKRGHENLLLAAANGPLLEQCTRESFQCDTLGLASFLWASKLVDVIHAHDARSHTLAAIWAARPLLVSRRVAFPVKRHLFSRWKYGRPQLYAAVSRIVAGELSKAGVPGEKIRVVHDGVPLLPNRWNPNGPVIVPHFRSLHKHGAQKQDAQKLDTMSLDACRLANVPMLRSTRLETDLDGAGLLVYLTRSEGLGSAALLAMSAGVPVIASNVGGLREVIQDGETGLLVANEVGAVAAAVTRLREQKDLARWLSTNARELIVQKFSEDLMVAETLALYESLLRG